MHVARRVRKGQICCCRESGAAAFALATRRKIADSQSECAPLEILFASSATLSNACACLVLHTPLAACVSTTMPQHNVDSRGFWSNVGVESPSCRLYRQVVNRLVLCMPDSLVDSSDHVAHLSYLVCVGTVAVSFLVTTSSPSCSRKRAARAARDFRLQGTAFSRR